MDLDSTIGQLFFVGFDGTLPSRGLEQYLARLRPGGLIHFSRNIVDGPQVRNLNQVLLAAVTPPPLIAVDQEGGRVSRLRSILPPLPPAASLARESDERLTAYGGALGAALAALGFNADFAPVVDLSSQGAPSGIGDRSFGGEASEVVRCASAFVRGLGGAGIASFLKHFPGLGATVVDSHVSLPLCPRDEATLWERDLLPYRSCAREAAGVMVGHAYYPALDPEAPIPASLSRRVVTRLLRERIGYEGLVVTDDLEMGAVAGPDPGELAVKALLAGNDMVMFCNRPDAAIQAMGRVREAMTSGRLDTERIEGSIARILEAKRRFGLLEAGRPAGPDALEAAIAGLAPFAVA